MGESLSAPWPWYVGGPLIGALVLALLLLDGRVFGISSSFRHLCAALPVPGRWRPSFLRYDWRGEGLWNLVFVVGIALGGWISIRWMGTPDSGSRIAPDTRAALTELGLENPSGLFPSTIFSWEALLTPVGVVLIVGGGFLVGFGTRYAGGCTSGHAISGLANRQLPSLVAVVGFFVGGLIATHLLLPLLLS